MPHRWSRRHLVQSASAVGLGLLVGCGRWPGQAAPPARVYRLGILASGANPPDSANIQALHEGLREQGYVVGQNVTVEYRQGIEPGELTLRAAELVQLAPDIIVVAGGNPSVRAVRDATSTIPIIMAQAGVDPVAMGLIASLAQPGGNVTGFTQITAELAGKRLEFLKDTVPAAARVGVLGPVESPDKRLELGELQGAAQVLGLAVQALEVRTADDLARAFEAATHEQIDALVVLQENVTIRQRTRIADLASTARLPAIYETPLFVEAGGLMSYGVNLPHLYRRVATHVDKILKGAKPGDLPVERPTRFDFVINLRTAQALGLAIPHHVLLQATEVIQ
jgi:putative tryptophan/tyrosine transport system substrate-binding protein